MRETKIHHPTKIFPVAPNVSLSLPILVAMLGFLLLEPVSPQFSPMYLVRPLLSFLGGASCIGVLRIVLQVLLGPDSD